MPTALPQPEVGQCRNRLYLKERTFGEQDQHFASGFVIKNFELVSSFIPPTKFGNQETLWFVFARYRRRVNQPD
jgi:hypothetical protein